MVIFSGDAHLSSQYSGGRDKGIMSLRIAWIILTRPLSNLQMITLIYLSDVMFLRFFVNLLVLVWCLYLTKYYFFKSFQDDFYKERLNNFNEPIKYF